jgi:hypothetical protein
MAETRPRGEQIRFESAKTGSHNLDTYLEACELGTSAPYKTLPALIDELFTSAGDIDPSILEFQVSGTDLQFRLGNFAPGSSTGWTTIGMPATSAATAAAASATAANTSAVASAASAVTAEGHKTNAETAQTSAIAARGLAEDYRDDSYQWATRAHNSSYTDSASNTNFSAYHYAQEAASSASVVSGKILKDADNDTRIDTEAITDEDIIRFQALGDEQLQITSTGVKVIKSGGGAAYTLPRVTGASGDYLIATDSSGTIGWEVSPSQGLEDVVLLGLDIV